MFNWKRILWLGLCLAVLAALFTACTADEPQTELPDGGSMEESEGTTEAPTAHVHTPGPAVMEHIFAPTCYREGSVDIVHYCTGCTLELSRETLTQEKLAHTPGAEEHRTVRKGTCEVDGSYEAVVCCTVCHNHDFFKHF